MLIVKTNYCKVDLFFYRLVADRRTLGTQTGHLDGHSSFPKKKEKKDSLIKDKNRMNKKKLGVKVSSQNLGIDPKKDNKKIIISDF
jgi:hypothetical protein